MIGKKSAVPGGTVQLRVTSPGACPWPKYAPPRNQTFPDCPVLQSAVSNSGCPWVGSEKDHCNHASDHWPRVLPKACEWAGRTPGVVMFSPAPAPAPPD